MHLRTICLLVLALSAATSARGQAARIILDGDFGDWDALAPAQEDPIADAGSGLDLHRLWIANDEQFLFLRFELGLETLIQDSNQLVLYLDTDNNTATGEPFHGVGAELVWSFGERTGVFSADGAAMAVGHAAARIVTAPTVSSTEFEIAFRLDALPDGARPLFPGADLRIALRDLTSGDRLPDGEGGVAYRIQDASGLPNLSEVPLAKERPTDVRFLAYNVERDGVFGSDRNAPFNRLLAAIQPDIIGFQEILGHSAAETESLVRAALGHDSSEIWYSERVNPDLVVVSRYPILASYSIPGGFGGDANAAFLLDLTSRWGTEVLLINAHPPCCRNDDARQLDFDAMMAFVRDSRAGTGTLSLGQDVPIVILGDMNMVGEARQLSTLLNGDIVNTSRWGSPFAPDWDGTSLRDLSPRHVALPMTYTWYNDESAFHPGRLDFVVFTDSVLEPGNGFVLFTLAMSAESLSANSLLSGDATTASDHLPVVADFRLKRAASTGSAEDALPFESSLSAGFPNPTEGTATIRFSTRQSGYVRLILRDVLGREVRVLRDETLEAGEHQTTADLTGLPPGVYFYTLLAGGAQITRPISLVR